MRRFSLHNAEAGPPVLGKLTSGTNTTWREDREEFEVVAETLQVTFGEIERRTLTIVFPSFDQGSLRATFRRASISWAKSRALESDIHSRLSGHYVLVPEDDVRKTILEKTFAVVEVAQLRRPVEQ